MQITIAEGTPDFEPGSYALVLIDVQERSFPEWATEKNKFGKPDNGDRVEWTWGAPDDDTLTISHLTSPATGPRSTMFPILVALLGADKVIPGLKFDTSSLIGKKAIVTIGLSDKNYSKVISVGPMPTQEPRKRPQPIAQPAEEVADEGLPF